MRQWPSVASNKRHQPRQGSRSIKRGLWEHATLVPPLVLSTTATHVKLRLESPPHFIHISGGEEASDPFCYLLRTTVAIGCLCRAETSEVVWELHGCRGSRCWKGFFFCRPLHLSERGEYMWIANVGWGRSALNKPTAVNWQLWSSLQFHSRVSTSIWSAPPGAMDPPGLNASQGLQGLCFAENKHFKRIWKG